MRSILGDLSHQRWQAALPLLVDEFEHLLLDALDLLRDMGDAQDRSDKSYWGLPSIFPHPQNRGFREWVTLIELLRDSWLAHRNVNPGRAQRIAQGWFDRPYPTFKRLALFAAAQSYCIDVQMWVSWLLADGAWWLWTVNLKREVLRLLALQGHNLAAATADQLQLAILEGPPREMFPEGLEPEQWQQTVDHSTWLRLSKLRSSGLVLNQAADSRLAQLSLAYPGWRLSDDGRDEFSLWMSSSSAPDAALDLGVTVAPTRRDELANWLKLDHTEHYGQSRDRWSEAIRKHPLKSLGALTDLPLEEVWPTDRWLEALRVWSAGRLVVRIWNYAAPVIQALPDHILLELAHGLAGWFEAVSKKSVSVDVELIALCKRLIALLIDPGNAIGEDADTNVQPMTDAINHPVGQAVQVLMNLFFKRELHDNQGLPEPFEPPFTEVCNTDIGRFRHGRVILASNLIALFRIDKQWTGRYLLSLLNWDVNAAEAKAAWEGFLWSPRIYAPLLKAFKAEFLQTPHHYQALGEHRQQFAGFFTYAALGPIEGYTVEELRTALAALPEEGLDESAQALSQALEGAVNQREAYWKNRIQPYLHHIWPKSRDRASVNIAESLARLTLATGAEFPKALDVVAHWLQPLEHSYSVVEQLYESELAERFPESASSLLNMVIHDQPWPSPKLGRCLASIVEAKPALANDMRYQRLVEYNRRRRG